MELSLWAHWVTVGNVGIDCEVAAGTHPKMLHMVMIRPQRLWADHLCWPSDLTQSQTSPLTVRMGKSVRCGLRHLTHEESGTSYVEHVNQHQTVLAELLLSVLFAFSCHVFHICHPSCLDICLLLLPCRLKALSHCLDKRYTNKV